MKVPQCIPTVLATMAVAAAVAVLAAPSSAMTADRSDVVSRYMANNTQAPDALGRYVGNMITDTLAPGGSPAGTHFVTDTLAPGGGASVVTPAAGGGVSWWDTGVGFSAALVLMGLWFAARILIGRRFISA
jgi:hypothetical protein